MKQPKIKVGILQNRDLIVFRIHGDYQINNTLKIKDKRLTAHVEDDRIVIKENGSIIFQDQSISLDPLKPLLSVFRSTYRVDIENVVIGIDFHWERVEVESFEGKINIVNKNGKLSLINEIEIEKYLESVISSEMNAASPYEYLKAHAIISRSWLISQLERNKNHETKGNFIINDNERILWHDKTEHEDFDVCADDHCQRYQGITRIVTNKSTQAVKETSGIVLIYNDKVCDTRYSKCCGGITEQFENVWEDVHHPYLKAIYDGEIHEESFPAGEEEFSQFIKSSPPAYCNTQDENLLSTVLNFYDQTTKDFFRWKIEIKQLALKTLLNLKLGIDFGEIKALIPLERGNSGRVKKLKIVGTKKELVLGKELEIRRALSEKHLYSSAFVVEPVYSEGSDIPHKFVLYGAGWGHGVGFCQIGGAVMASKGFKFKDILNHYFPGAELKKIY